VTAVEQPSVVVRHRLHAVFAGRPGRLGGLELDADGLRVRLGPWQVVTPLGNLAGADVTAPVGVRLSFAGGGLTFGTAPVPGVRIRFREPVGPLRLAWLTVTVAEPELIAAAIERIRR
jgi:hypothetical protein